MRRRHVTLVLACLGLPLAGLGAAAVQYGRAQADLDRAARAAAEDAAMTAANSWRDGADGFLQAGVAAARTRFATAPGAEVAVALSQSGGDFAVIVSYRAGVSTALSRALGLDAVSITGQAAARLSDRAKVEVPLSREAASR